MNEVIKRLFLLAGGILLVVGGALPWVFMDSLTIRKERLLSIANLLPDNLPDIFLDPLKNLGLSPNMSFEQMWDLITPIKHTELFNYLNNKERLFAWDLMQIDVPTTMKIGIGMVGLLIIWIVIMLGGEMRNKVLLKPATNDGSFNEPSMVPVIAAILGFMTFCLFSLQMPYLDSLGYAGNWNFALLDIITGAKVTIGACVLIPVGSLSIFFSNLEELVNFIYNWYFQMPFGE